MRKLLAVTTIFIILLSSCASVPEAGNLSLQDRQRILEVAQKYIGIPYRWGGQDFWWEENPGVDCSGYIINVYKEAIAPSGLALPFDDSTVAVIFSTFSEATDTPLQQTLRFLETSCSSQMEKQTYPLTSASSHTLKTEKSGSMMPLPVQIRAVYCFAATR